MDNPKNALDFRLFLLAALGLPAQIGCWSEPDPPAEEPPRCEDPTALAGGFVECADGAINRPTTETCANENNAKACAGDEEEFYCETDADCTAGPNGFCASRRSDDLGTPYCGCIYSCASDADCGDAQICLCSDLAAGTSWSYCMNAPECKTDADCGPEGECGLSFYDSGCGYSYDLACRLVGDECHGADDCGEEYDFCSTEGDATGWICEERGDCAIGRPLYVDGAARTAPLTASIDWSSPLDAADLQQIPVSARPALAARWSEIGRGEHASVASFARFSLHLLSLGAPPELLLATQQAAADEVRHARGAFAIASAIAGTPIGPGPMDLSDVSLKATPAQILRDLILEGCVGETVAVVEVLEGSANETIPAIAAFRQAVARDESEHAALAWRCLAWMLQQRPELASVAREAFDDGIARCRPQDRDAIERIVRPCAGALLASTAAPEATVPTDQHT